MKKLTFKPILLMAFAALSFTACKKDKTTDSVQPPVTVNDGEELAKVLRSAAPQFQTFSINAATGAVITTTHGTRFKIPGNAFLNGGLPVTGTVTVSIKEIQDVSAMILADKPTVTDDGKMLISYGEFFVAAEQGNNKLQLNKDSAVIVQIPQRAGGGGKEIPMWGGDSAVSYTLEGYDYQNNPITLTKNIYLCKGLDWKQQPGYAFFNSTDGTLDFKLSDLFSWFNCDALGTEPGDKTTVMGYFNSHFNENTGTNYGLEQPTMLYFKPKDRNAVIKFYNVILSSPVAYHGLHSYQTSIPEGMQGTFLAMSSVDGKFYAQQKDVTIADPGSASYTSVSFDLQEVSASDLLNLIDQMKTK